MSLFRRHVFYNKLTNGSTILYTTTDGNVLDISYPDIVSNTYENGQGILTFNKKMTIVPHIFADKSKLKTIVFPEDCTTFSQCAFWGDVRLEELHFLSPKLSIKNGSDPSLIQGLWYNTSNNSLKKIYSPNNSFDDNKCLVIDGILYCFAPGTIADDSEYTIPYNIHTIAGYTMSENSKIRKLNMHDNIKYIYRVGIGDNEGPWRGSYKFSCNIPNYIIYIDTGAFRMDNENVNIVENLNIPATCEVIGNQAFMRWNNLKTIHFYVPSTGLILYYMPFESCKSVTDVYCHTEFPPTLYNSSVDIFDNDADPKLHIPIGTYKTYSDSEFGYQFRGRIIEDL